MKLSVRHLTSGYGNKNVLAEIDLSFEPNNLICVVGPNGSGKSTLLRCLDCILPLQKGEVLLDGKNLKSFSRRNLAHHLAYVPQSASQKLNFSVFEVVMMGRRPFLKFRVGEKDRKAVNRVLEMMGLLAYSPRCFDELSGGEKQKVLIARALAQETEILLLDEPTSNLDLLYQLEVLELLQFLKNQRQMTIIVAIHDLNLAARYADYMVMLKKGQVFDQGKPHEILNQKNIQAVYGVEAKVDENEERGLNIIPLRPVPKSGVVNPMLINGMS